MGISILAKVFALVAALQSSSFFSSNPSITFSSREKTLTTRWPSIISSTYPLTFPMVSCWRLKYAEVRFPILAMTSSMMMSMATTKRVNRGLKTSIIINTPATEIPEEMSWGIPWDIISLKASVSLV